MTAPAALGLEVFSGQEHAGEARIVWAIRGNDPRERQRDIHFRICEAITF